ncbi:hypothetical protein [Jannaschia pohangensis]|nr:hypothetical protein [Jannaschia pohangensis]
MGRRLATMAHLTIAALAIGLLVAVLAVVFIIQSERPGLRRIGLGLLAALVLLASVIGALS